MSLCSAGYENCNCDALSAQLTQDMKGESPERIAGLSDALSDIELMMDQRHKKYGTGNIAKHGPVGILVRLDDKFQRLENGSANFDDETIEQTLDDIIGYSLIWKLWLRGQWPGSEKK